MTQKLDCMVAPLAKQIFGLKLLLTLKVKKNPDSNIQLGKIFRSGYVVLEMLLCTVMQQGQFQNMQVL